MSDKPKWPLAEAHRVADGLTSVLAPFCDQIIIAGSIRRQREQVGDIEIVYVPKIIEVPNPETLLGEPMALNQAEAQLGVLLLGGVIAKRLNVNGTSAWGMMNKLAVHCASGIPVDLFAATAENWFSYLVCRTGPAESNIRIASAAQARGWKWNPYGAGFSRGGALSGEREERAVMSEAEVFQFVGLACAQPEDRK